MSEQRCGYLGGLQFANHYAVAGRFQGSLPAGFMASALFRLERPGEVTRPGAVPLQSVICGNWQPTGQATARGWRLYWNADDTEDANLQFEYGDVGETVIGFPFGLEPLQLWMLSQNTLLITVFFGVLSSEDPNPQLFVFANGNQIADPLNIATGYTPADATNLFRVGAGEQGGVAGIEQLGGNSLGVAGFSYFDGLPNDAGSTAPLATMVGVVTDQWNVVQEAEDMVAAPLVTDLYSVKQRLPRPRPTWEPSLGATALQRVGAASLVTSASKPRFYHGPWDIPLPPV